MEATIGTLDHNYREAGEDPYPFYESVRNQSPVYWDESVNGWLVTDYDSCSYVLRREDIFNRADRVLPGGKALRGDTRDVSLLSGKDHDILHGFLMRVTARRATTDFSNTVIRPITDKLIDTFAHHGHADLAAEFADQLPVLVGAALVGLDLEDQALVKRVQQLKLEFDRWRETMGAHPEDAERASKFGTEMKELVMPVIRERKAHPQDDLISEFWEKGPTVFPDWDEEDTYAACRSYLSGGETLYALRNLVYLLVTNTELKNKLLADEARIPRFVEEALRVIGVVHWQIRIATKEIQLGDVHIKEGERVFPMYAAANRDPHRYQKPAEVELDEDRRQAHLAFGLGPRYCTGAALARLQACEAIRTLLVRLKNLRLDDHSQPPRLVGFHVRSFAPLHARFDV